MSEYNENMEELEKGGHIIELFCLRPKKFENQSVMVRLKFNNKWSGWRLKEEIVNSLGLISGETISTTVSPKYTEGLSDDVDSITLFACGEGADWLLENKVSAGTIIDCMVKCSYVKIPVGHNDKMILSASLIFEKGFVVVENEPINNDTSIDDELIKLIKDFSEQDKSV